MRRNCKIDTKLIQPVFNAPLLSDLKDTVSGTSPTVTGSMSTFDPNKGLYFNGSSGLKWSFSQLAFDPTTIDIDTSYTLLLDFNRSARSGHDVMFEMGKSWQNDLYFMYEYNNNAISINVASKRLPSNDHNYTSLNTQYNNCGLWYDGATHTMHRIISGVVDYSFPISTPPTLVDNLLVGNTSYGSDRMNGYLKNVRFYLADFDEQMLINQ